MTQFIIGDLLTGRRIQVLPDVVSASWSEKLNAADYISVTVPMDDPATRRLALQNSATVGKSFLAAVEGDLILAAGPIWGHTFDEDDNNHLTITASGLWSYFDHRVLLPVLAGRNPSDPTTDTRYSPIISDPNADGYPWPTDTSKSLQGIARALVAQAQSWTGGNVPVILPAEIPGDQTRWYKGSDLAQVGERLSQLTDVIGGPDIKFQPRFTVDRLGVEWVMLIGTPTQPLISGAIKPVFTTGLPESSVSRFRLVVDGTGLASQAFASGGRTADKVIITQSNSAALPSAGYPLLETVDSSHSSVSQASTLQGYSDEAAVLGARPVTTISFSHNTSHSPSLGGFNVGDFCEVRVTNNYYLEDGPIALRLTGRSGDAKTDTVNLTFAPAVI